MAQATVEQVRALEKSHKELFILIAKNSQAWRDAVRLSFTKPLSDAEKTALYKFKNAIISAIGKWIVRNNKLREAPNGNVEFADVQAGDFFTDAGRKKVDVLVANYLGTSLKGLGLIPLLVWGVIAIAGFFTADSIVGEITTTSGEKESLLKATADYSREFKLTSTQAASIASQTQKEASEGTGFLSSAGTAMKWGVGIGGSALIIIGIKKIGDNFGWWDKNKK